MSVNQYQLIITALLIILLVGIGYNSAFTNDMPTCNQYVTNVYFYILLAILIIIFGILFIDKRRIAVTTTRSLLSFAISLILLFILYSINPHNYILNHFVWLLFIITLSISMYGTLRYSRYTNVASNSAIIVTILFTILTIIAWIKPEWIGLNWGMFLSTALLIGILAWIIPLIVGINYSVYYKILSAIFIVIFSTLILYDTKILKIKAENCVFPDYPKDSLSLILDILNLFNFTNNL